MMSFVSVHLFPTFEAVGRYVSPSTLNSTFSDYFSIHFSFLVVFFEQFVKFVSSIWLLHTQHRSTWGICSKIPSSVHWNDSLSLNIHIVSRRVIKYYCLTSSHTSTNPDHVFLYSFLIVYFYILNVKSQKSQDSKSINGMV